MIEVLAMLIIPDGDGPGVGDARVIEQLDRLVGASIERRQLYREGLKAVDRVARRKFRKQFAALRTDQQRSLLMSIDEVSRATRRRRGGWLDRSLRRAYLAWSGSRAASRFFRLLVRDIMAIFYSSEVTWRWLGYDGPPFLPFTSGS